MTDRTALTAGIAAASIAAVVAATPALVTPPNHDVQVAASAAAALAQRTVTGDVQLTAFTLQDLLSAFADGYYDSTYGGDSTSGVTAAIAYALDNLLADFDYDDDLFAAGGGRDFSTVYYHLAQDLSLPTELVSFILDPINTTLTLGEGLGVPAVVQDLINDPINSALTLGEGLGVPAVVQDFINDPILTALNALGGPLGPLLTALAEDPIGTMLAVSGLPDDVAAFLMDPIVGGFDLLENRIGLSEEFGDFVAGPTITTARLLAQALGLLHGAGLTGSSTAAFRSSTDEVAADVDKAPTLFKLELPTTTELEVPTTRKLDLATPKLDLATPKLDLATPKLDFATPKQVAEDVETAVDGFAKVVTPLKEKFKEKAVEIDAFTPDSATEDAPIAPSFRLPKLPKPDKSIAKFSDNLGKRAQSIADSLHRTKGKSEAKTSSPDRKPGGFGGFGGHKHEKKAKAAGE